MFPLGTRVVLSELPLTVRLPAGVSPSPTVNAIALVEVSSLIVWLRIFEIVGGPSTVSTKESLAVFVPSLTVTVIVATPPLLVGVTATVRFAPLPPKTMFALGTRLVLFELPLSVRLPTGVSGSETVNGIAPVDVPAGVVRSRILLIVGGNGPAAVVVIVRLQPVPKFPKSPGPSSYTYNDQVPFAFVPLNADNSAA